MLGGASRPARPRLPGKSLFPSTIPACFADHPIDAFSQYLAPLEVPDSTSREPGPACPDPGVAPTRPGRKRSEKLPDPRISMRSSPAKHAVMFERHLHSEFHIVPGEQRLFVRNAPGQFRLRHPSIVPWASAARSTHLPKGGRQRTPWFPTAPQCARKRRASARVRDLHARGTTRVRVACGRRELRTATTDRFFGACTYSPSENCSHLLPSPTWFPLH